MTPFHQIVIIFISVPISLGTIIFAIKKWNKKKFYDEMEYINDSPFPFHPDSDDGNDYIVFELEDDTTLWCDYRFGIRSDGVYGLSNLTVKGLNGNHHRIKLKIGQSIFPIIESIDRFEEWTNEKAFKTDWDGEFTYSWNEMKKKLDNLRILEAKSKEKEKKNK
jgi:hypothetical protein